MARTERALYERMELACAAATARRLSGRFRTWDESGVLAVLATDPSLAFLSTVSGVRPESVPIAIAIASVQVRHGSRPTVMVSTENDSSVELFRAAGLKRGEDRALAVRSLDDVALTRRTEALDISETSDVDEFLRILLAGYGAHAPVERFIAAEHRRPEVRRFVLSDHGTPIAAGAMTQHADVAVIGGSATLPHHRGRGAQTRLIEHRVRIAAESGCVFAVATVQPGSVSEANLLRAGFRLHRRRTWIQP